MVIWAASSPYFALTYPLQRSWEVTIGGLPDVKSPPSRFINPIQPRKEPLVTEFLLHLDSTVLADEFEFGFMESVEAQFEEVLVTGSRRRLSQLLLGGYFELLLGSNCGCCVWAIYRCVDHLAEAEFRDGALSPMHHPRGGGVGPGEGVGCIEKGTGHVPLPRYNIMLATFTRPTDTESWHPGLSSARLDSRHRGIHHICVYTPRVSRRRNEAREDLPRVSATES